MSILVTGGLGFIGSHTIVELTKNNYENIIIIDNLINSKVEVFNKIKKITNNENIIFFQIDILDKTKLEEIFAQNNIESIIHFAALKSVNESIKMPILYYKNNVEGTLNLLEMMIKYKTKNFIFSSSCTVYGTQKYPVDETCLTGIGITNPYGKTKYFIEEIIKDYSITYPQLNFVILRYFNPVGAHDSGLIGENPNNLPNNLCPYILKVSIGELDKLTIYGHDYNTKDGTCIRDYIHVVDLAEAHYVTLNSMLSNKIFGLKIYNIGTGCGTSVLEFVKTFEKVNNVKINFEYGPKRNGDLESVYSKSNIMKKELEWECKKSLEDMCRDSYNFIKKNNNLF
jgi:UDP-glucose 4-epimerase